MSPRKSKNGSYNSRKNRKARNQKKPRDDWIHFQGQANEDGEVTFNFGVDGSFHSPEVVDGTLVAYRAYERDSGKHKIISQSPGLGNATQGNVRQNLVKNFDAICAIDTNNYFLNDRRVSISSGLASTGSIKNPSGIRFDRIPSFVFEDIPKHINPETVGWLLLLHSVVPILGLDSNDKLAVFVDSELGKLQRINSRKEPFLDKFYLPHDVQLFYASSDVNDDLPNKIMKMCDRESRNLAKKIESSEVELTFPLKTSSKYYSGVAQVSYSESPYQLGGGA